MKLRAITLRNVRRFTAPVCINGIADGLNVLAAPNEHGKSTVFDALQALFFAPHGSAAREVKALRPHPGGAPCVSVRIETAEGLFEVTKQWLSKASATVTQEGRLIAQADAAEDWIGRQLGGGDGPTGLIWVRQGSSGLTDGSSREQAAALGVRRDLLSSVTGEVEAMTGGRRMDLALARCRDELAQLATRTGAARTGGAWKAARDRVADLTAARDRLAETATALQEALAARARARRALDELEDPDTVAETAARLEAARTAHEAAQRHAERIEAAEAAVQTATLSKGELQGRLDRLRTAVAERDAAQAALRSAEADGTAARDAQAKAQAGMQAAEATLAAARIARKAAEAARSAAARRQAARDGAARRADLADRIKRAEQARTQMDTAGAAARHGPDARGLRDLEALALTLQTARAARDATATQVVMAYAPDASGVTLDGVPLEDGAPLALTGPATLALPGLGTLSVRPGGGGQSDGTVERAEAALQAALGRQNAASLEAARAAAAARAEAEQAHARAQAVFASLAPDGLAALIAARDAIPPAEAQDGPDLPTAEAALMQADADQTTAQTVRDVAAERLSSAERDAALAAAALANATARQGRADAALAQLGDVAEADLTAQLAQADQALAEATERHTRTRAAAPDPQATRAALARAQSVVDSARTEVARLRPEIATLNERIGRSAGDAVEERLAAADLELAAATADLALLDREVAVLHRLEEVLQSARNDARDRYFAPVAAELQPLLHLLWPEAELTWQQDTLLPDALIRGGQSEPLEILSGGTREQVALLVRLAFARMLARTGRDAPVILDDALVYTDDDRIERMFNALHRQAADVQIVVLSCRQRAFRNLGGRVLHLEAAQEA